MSARQLVRGFHRWLGAALCLLFLTWFLSGFVMTFAGFPSVGERERLIHAAPLRAESIRVQPGAALAELTRNADAIELRAVGDRALYSVRSAGRSHSVFADTGERPSELDEHTLSLVAASWLGATTSDRTRLTEVDQWTPQADRRGELPCLRFRAADERATELYVSFVDGQVLQLTTARTRFLAWIGAIPHWIYPILLRRHAGTWRALVIALSALGAVASASGLLHGLSVMRVARRSARGKRLSLSPFRDRWLALHHWLGLLFGALSFTWVLSGMLSFYPFADSAESWPTSGDVAALRAAPLDPLSFSRNLGEALDACGRSLGGAVKRVELTVAGQTAFYVCTDGHGASRILNANDDSPAENALTKNTIASLSRALGAGATVAEETLLESGDAYYYPTHFEPELTFPVLRTHFTSGLVTYVSPRTLHVERRYSSSGAAYRWLYHGLHSLDFPALYRRAWLWHPTIVAALLGASLLAASGVWLSFRVATGRSRRPWRATRQVQPSSSHSDLEAS
ncbi:MAG TPA: hypothetical protein VER96_19045 [Polyangiaceae bacterium]|nr:hypothetical protein [Polyangiaceae bacterium]